MLRPATNVIVLIALVLAGALGAPSGAATESGGAGAQTPNDELRLLERYRPSLNYAKDERYFAQPVSLPPKSAEVLPGDRIYGHVAREGDDVWLQYWMYYAYNPQDRQPFNTGRHEGDWELIQLRLADAGTPDLSVSSQHSWAEACDWNEIERTDAGPEYFVANGSHATYSKAGDYGRPFPDPTDEADGEGASLRPQLTVIRDGDPAWVDYEGPWGMTEAGFIPGESPSPPGPRFQDSQAWSKPTSYLLNRARPCGSGAPGRPLQTVIFISILVAGSGIAAWRLVRRKRGVPR